VNGWLARQLPGLLIAAGLTDVRVRGFMPLEREAGSFYATIADRVAEVAVEVGAITGDERTRWLAELHAQQKRGSFLAGRLHVFAWGVRPDR
jgi:hypothetical protein